MRAMDIILWLIDFILHVDVYLLNFVREYGAWVYALLFLIVFVETGLVVMSGFYRATRCCSWWGRWPARAT